MRRLIVLFVLLLSGCITVYVTATPTGVQNPTNDSLPARATPTGGPLPTAEATATLAATPGPTVTIPTPTPSPLPTRPPVANELLCRGFECGWQYDSRSATGSLKVPLAWKAFWSASVPDACPNGAQNQTNDSNQPCSWSGGIPAGDRFCGGFMPAVELEFHASHVHEGASSARVIEAGTNCPAGLYQVIDGLSAGSTYILSGFVFNWSTDKPVVDSPSTSYVRSWIGIDPAGGTDPWAASVKWSAEESAQDHFAYLEVKAKAESSKITVFLLSIPNYAVARSDSFWDDLSLLEIAGPQSALIEPTATPSIIEVTPWPFPDQLGTIVYDTVTNLRICDDALWAGPFDPTSCPFSTDGFEVVQTMQPGNKAGVAAWGIDRYGNRWARYLAGQTSVACFKGLPRGKFYPGAQVDRYDGLASTGKLPPAQNPCDVK